MHRWRIAVDRGGTFTDVLAVRGDEVRQAKVLSSGDDPVVRGVRKALRLGGADAIPVDDIDEVRIGTTVATNALLTRSGARTVLVTTRGFRDLPLIGDQSRPDLFALEIKRPQPVAQVVIEAHERVGVDGEVVLALDEDQLRADLEHAKATGCTVVAIALLHGWAHDTHERVATFIAEAIGFDEIVTSRVSPVRGLIRRADTCSLDASLTPVLHAGIARTTQSLPGVRVRCMQSSGGLVGADAFRGCRAVLSGPAGGLLGAAGEAARRGVDRIVAFDMGGTSTDVSWYGGDLERDTDTVLGGVRVSVPMLRVHTVAAGGGSKCDVRGGRLRVGPASAGADPGPASYGRGGPATLTDCHVVLGRLPAGELPAVFGHSGNALLDSAAAAAALEAHTPVAGLGLVALAEGMLDVAVESIAAAIREVSVARGHDVRQAALCAFGGAGGQVACRVADRLGMDTVIVPARAGVLSAAGIAQAAESVVRHASVETPLRHSHQLGHMIDALTAQAGEGGVEWTRRVRAGIRAEGWDRAIQVEWGGPDDMAAAFKDACRRRFGFEPRGALIIESLEVEVMHQPPKLELDLGRDDGVKQSVGRMWSNGSWRDVPVVRGEVDAVEGPAILLHDGATTVVESGWRVQRMNGCGGVTLRRTAGRIPVAFQSDNPADIEVANRRFLSTCREMGTVLQHTAVSVNVKERRDYSCAIFDESGRLVANGPHMPVHLGSMGESVRRVVDVHGGSMGPGDAFLDNDPAHGGTHLPDLTVVSPLWDADGLRYIVASRAHHADVGGTTPGSMPADSTRIAEEGVVFDAVTLMRGGELQEAAIRAALASGPWPARRPDVNMDDLRAQLAANARGAALLGEMRDAYGGDLRAPMKAVRANAAACVVSAIGELGVGDAVAKMDGGEQIRVQIIPRGGRLTVDFEGTSPQSTGNLNAPRAVVRAAVLYALRCLVADDIPLNDGCLEPVDLRIPEGSLLSPAPGAAVVGGNVETSQVVVDALFAAAGVLAGSQGTMNNLTFGNDTLQYYETICGGAGAGPGFGGASAVHTHMTNSLLTDPEVLETRYPVRLERFGVRHGSGGSGLHAGGDGVVRAIRFLTSLTVSLLSGHRLGPPRGLGSGGDGACGGQWLEYAGGEIEQLPGTFRRQVSAGDVLVIETPGGGGASAPS